MGNEGEGVGKEEGMPKGCRRERTIRNRRELMTDLRDSHRRRKLM